MDDCFSGCDVGDPAVKNEECCVRPVCKPKEQIVSTSVEKNQREICECKNTKSVGEDIENFSMSIIESPVVVQSCKVTGGCRCNIDCKHADDKK